MNFLVCIDASFVVRTLIPGDFSEEAEQLLASWLEEKRTLIAPALLAFEVTSTLRRLVHLKAIAPAHGDDAFARFQQIPIRLSRRRGILLRAWSLAKEFNRPRAYDTAYIALAEMMDCAFWTADERLYNAVGDQLERVKWIGAKG